MTMLPRASSPEELGISSQGVLDFIKQAEARGLAFHSLMLLRHGQVACELSWAPYDSRTPHTMFSLTKSFTSAAAGFAVKEGLLRYEDSVADILPDKLGAKSDPRLKEVTLHSLLCMGSGLDPASDRPPRREEDWARATLSHPVVHEPGTQFHYNSMGSYLVSAMVQRVTGQSCRDYLMPRLFEPLGIARPQWDSCPKGVSMGGFGLHLGCEDIARFGQLLLQLGVWQGRQLLPEGWVRLATRKHIDNGGFNNQEDWGQGYGYQFWRTRGGRYRGDGMFGQICMVDEAKELVIACTAGIPDMGAQLNLFHELLVPAATMPPSPEDVQLGLQRRLKNLRYRLPRHEAGMPALAGTYLSKAGRQLRLTEELDGSLSLALRRRGDACPLTSFRLQQGRPYRGESSGQAPGEGTLSYLGQYSWRQGRLHCSVRFPGAPYTLLMEAEPQGPDLLCRMDGAFFDSGEYLYRRQNG